MEDWLRAEGFAYRHQQRRWRTWTRPDRPGEGLRPDGIEEDEEPNVYPSGASINVSMWDVIEKKFPEPGSERKMSLNIALGLLMYSCTFCSCKTPNQSSK